MIDATIFETNESCGLVKTTPCGDSNGYAHYWVINDRNLGICKKCGDSKQFPNVWLGQTISCDWKEQILDKAHATWTSDKQNLTEE